MVLHSTQGNMVLEPFPAFRNAGVAYIWHSSHIYRDDPRDGIACRVAAIRQVDTTWTLRKRPILAPNSRCGGSVRDRGLPRTGQLRAAWRAILRAPESRTPSISPDRAGKERRDVSKPENYPMDCRSLKPSPPMAYARFAVGPGPNTTWLHAQPRKKSFKEDTRQAWRLRVAS